jgi:O-succinylbenzoic acid--CoA ligase
VGGLNILYRCAVTGATVILQEGFTATSVNEAIDHKGVTVTAFVPTMLQRVLEERGERPFPTTLRAILLGGGPIPSGLIERSPQVLCTYGLTEACSQVTLVPPGAAPQERHSAGRPLPGVKLRILDELGHPRADGETGTIAVSGPTIMQGYLGDPEATAAALRSGWLCTNDLGRIDSGGNLHFVGRRDDVIVSGGEKIHPAEIERSLAHPQILEAVVLGAVDPEWGEVAIAFVVARNPMFRPDDVRRSLAGRLARHKLPRVVMVEEIPRLANGKPDRRLPRASVLRSLGRCRRARCGPRRALFPRPCRSGSPA